ncbi:MAG: hypothetical protein ACRDTH_14145 [Pseudonocardiaceae bacterium]
MRIKELLIAAIFIGIAVLLAPRSETAAPHHTGPKNVTKPQRPYPCEFDRSAQCTWDQYRQMAEDECNKERAQGGRCEIATNGPRPHVVRIPSDSERTDMRRKIDEEASRLCDKLDNAGYECRANNN